MLNLNHPMRLPQGVDFARSAALRPNSSRVLAAHADAAFPAPLGFAFFDSDASHFAQSSGVYLAVTLLP